MSRIRGQSFAALTVGLDEASDRQTLKTQKDNAVLDIGFSNCTLEESRARQAGEKPCLTHGNTKQSRMN